MAFGERAGVEEEQGSGSPQSPYSPDTWAAELKVRVRINYFKCTNLSLNVLVQVLTQTNHTETGHSGLAEQLWGSFAIEEGQVPADVETTEECVRLLERIGRPTEHLTSRRPKSEDPANSPGNDKPMWDTVSTKHVYEPPPKEEF